MHRKVQERYPAIRYIFFHNFYSYTFFINSHFPIGAPISPLLPYVSEAKENVWQRENAIQRFLRASAIYERAEKE